VGFVGPQLAPRWRFARAWSIGAVGAVGFGSGAPRDDSQTWWRAEAEARVHPLLGPGPTDFAVGFDAGFVGVADRAAAHPQTSDSAHSTSALAPAIGGLLAFDFAVSSAFALGFELRIFSFLFGKAEETAATFASYGTQIGASVGLSGTLRTGD
jgi:hypothetical protein